MKESFKVIDKNLENKVENLDTQMASLTQQQTFLFNCGSSLRHWRLALHNLKINNNTLLNISVIGDSITEGASSTDWVNDGYVGVIRNALKKKYGDTGKGIIPTFYKNASPLWTFTGSWNDSANFGVTKKSKVSLTTNDTASIAFNGTGIVLLVQKGTLSGTLSMSVDGGAAQPFDASGASAILPCVITGLTNGSHTLTVKNTTSSGKYVYIIGAYETNSTTGIRVNMCGRYGTLVENSSNAESLAVTEDYFQPKLTIISLMANDSSGGTDLTTYKNSIQTIITKALNYGDVLITSIGMHNPTSANESAYALALKELSILNNCGYIDIYNKWANGADATALGYLSGGVHPTDLGHMDIASTILSVIDI